MQRENRELDRRIRRVDQIVADLAAPGVSAHSAALVLEHLAAARRAAQSASLDEYRASLEFALEAASYLPDKELRAKARKKLNRLLALARPKEAPPGSYRSLFTIEQEEHLLESWGHIVHYVTVLLVGVALLADHLSNPEAPGMIQELLHFVHMSALWLAILQAVLFIVLSRNVGRELAEALEHPSPESPVNPDGLEFVTGPGPEFDALVLLNRAGFQGSSNFEMSVAEIEERNRAMVRKNPFVFMLVRDPSNEIPFDDFMGYTCVLPLNEFGADSYLNGVIKDRDIRASAISKPGEPCEHLLVFAIALDQAHQGMVTGMRATHYLYLLTQLRHHLTVLAQIHPGPPRRTVWAQSEHRKLSHNLERRGFSARDGKYSADGFALYALPLDVASLQKEQRAVS